MVELSTDFPELNPDDPTVEVWRTPVEDLQGDRPPGLINVNRYPFALSSHGIATFLQRPIALTPADLRAAEVEVAILGAGGLPPPTGTVGPPPVQTRPYRACPPEEVG